MVLDPDEYYEIVLEAFEDYGCEKLTLRLIIAIYIRFRQMEDYRALLKKNETPRKTRKRKKKGNNVNRL